MRLRKQITKAKKRKKKKKLELPKRKMCAAKGL